MKRASFGSAQYSFQAEDVQEFFDGVETKHVHLPGREKGEVKHTLLRCPVCCNASSVPRNAVRASNRLRCARMQQTRTCSRAC